MQPQPNRVFRNKHGIGSNTRAMIFDMDGVITNTMPDHYRAWKTVLRQQGIHVTKYDIYKREGQQGLPSLLEFCKENNIPMSLNRAGKILDEKEDLFKKIVKVRFIPGARGFLKFLKKQNKILGLVTGTSRHELDGILPRDIREIFDVIVTGTDVKKGKPDPESYALALKQLCLSPMDAIAVENAPCGIASAKAAGLRCFALTTSLPKKYLKGADHVFSSIKELRANMLFL